MKKIKIIIMTLAILLSIGGAFATRRSFDCRTAPQYYWNGTGYLPAGKIGIDYVCQSSAQNCTFWLVGGVYTLCQVGTYEGFPGLQKPVSK
jgi:hypothetical protein